MEQVQAYFPIISKKAHTGQNLIVHKIACIVNTHPVKMKTIIMLSKNIKTRNCNTALPFPGNYELFFMIIYHAKSVP